MRFLEMVRFHGLATRQQSKPVEGIQDLQEKRPERVFEARSPALFAGEQRPHKGDQQTQQEI